MTMTRKALIAQNTQLLAQFKACQGGIEGLSRKSLNRLVKALNTRNSELVLNEQNLLQKVSQQNLLIAGLKAKIDELTEAAEKASA